MTERPTPAEYAAFAASTCNPDRDDLIHHGLGLVCEYLEFRQAGSDEEQLEEIGDCLWFLAGIARVLGVDFAHLVQGNGRSGAFNWRRTDAAMEAILSAAKSSYAYGREIDQGNLLDAVDDLMDWVRYEADALGYFQRPEGWMPEIAAANMAKLRRRYPEGFSTAAAIERADKAGEP